MPPPPDAQLLARYATTRDEASFAEFVDRRLDGVYAAALRRVGGDTQLAEDVAQRVFTAAARHARHLARHPDLTGWLYVTARHLAANVVRAEQRRKARETKAHVMSLLNAPETFDWSRVAPVLDDAIEQLGAVDRTAILLRFMERRAYAEIGATLRLSEDAARMRVDRALERLRTVLARRGIASTTAALGVALANQAFAVAPTTLAAAVTTAATTGVSSGALFTAEAFLVMTKLKLGIAAAAALIAGALVVREVHAGLRLETEFRGLQKAQTPAARVDPADARLTRQLEGLAAAHADAGELARVRQRLAVLRARPNGVTDEAMLPLSAYGNRGWATPVAAFETFWWSREQGNADELAHAYGWTAESKAKIDRFFAALSPELRAEYQTPERMLALGAVGFRGAPEDPAALQILGQADYGDKTLVHAWCRLRSGKEVNATMLFQRVDDHWVVPFDNSTMDRTLAQHDPASGKRKP
jgi:RNA polymerase sigma factor (sigma-70 family)